MRVVRLHGAHDLRLHEESDPIPAPGQSLVRVETVGLCGSDLHWFDQGGVGDARVVDPVVPGHEMAGTALTGPHAGRLVAIDPAIPCERCPLCRQGHRNLCPHVAFSGHSTLDGSLRELMAWPDHLLHPLPEPLTAGDGAMLEPLGVALHTWDLAHARVGASVAIVGAGPIGLLVLQVARAAGAGRIVVVEPLAHRREAALRLGADAAVAPEHANLDTWGGDDGLGCEVSIECCGHDPAVELALRAARPGARVLLVGIPDDDRTSFKAGLVRHKGLTLVAVRRMKEMYERAIPLVASGAVDVRAVTDAAYPLGDSVAAFEAACLRRGLKVVVEPHR